MLNVMLSHDAFAEVVEDRDLRRQPADVRNPADRVRGQVEAPLHPRLDGVVDVLDAAADGVGATTGGNCGVGNGSAGARRHRCIRCNQSTSRCRQVGGRQPAAEPARLSVIASCDASSTTRRRRVAGWPSTGRRREAMADCGDRRDARRSGTERERNVHVDPLRLATPDLANLRGVYARVINATPRLRLRRGRWQRTAPARGLLWPICQAPMVSECETRG